MRVVVFSLLVGLAFPLGTTRAVDPPKEWSFSGVTQAAAKAEVRARVTGSITQVAVRNGDQVKKGDLLIEVDSRPYQIKRDAATAHVKEAEAQLSIAKLKAANTKLLRANAVVSPQELALAEAAETAAEAALTVAKAEGQHAELLLSWTRVVAPFDGRVSSVQATEGELAVADQSPILCVVSSGQLQVVFNVPESLFLSLQREGLTEPGMLNVAVGFAGEVGTPHAAKLAGIKSVFNSRTGSIQFRAALPNPKGLYLPGMTPRVRLTATQK